MALAGGKRVGRALVRTDACAGREKVARTVDPRGLLFWLRGRLPAAACASALSFRSRLGTSVS